MPYKIIIIIIIIITVYLILVWRKDVTVSSEMVLTTWKNNLCSKP
jgi:hypothetical protein